MTNAYETYLERHWPIGSTVFIAGDVQLYCDVLDHADDEILVALPSGESELVRGDWVYESEEGAPEA